MDAPVRYVRSRDGTRIAYCASGQGPALAYLQVPSHSHIELYPRLPGTREYLERLGRGRKLIRIDFRGTGMSERTYADHSPRALTDDLEAVLDDLGITQMDVLAGGARVTPALGLAMRRPGSVSRIVLAYPFTARPISRGQPLEPGVLGLMEANWDLYIENTTQRNARRPLVELHDLMAFVRRCVDQDNYVAEARASRQEEDWDSAANIHVPVLVLEFAPNVHIPPGLMQAFARCFPKGRYMALPEIALSPPYGDGELLLQAVAEFFGPLTEPAVIATADDRPLTPREREVLCLLAAGRTQREIAGALFISSSTVSRHIVSLYAKLGIHRRAEAVSWAIHHGFV
jgi:DNA-binding CsgD family transcriptional regulator/pimeloyl-ACP methyl ester carboxylesterase